MKRVVLTFGLISGTIIAVLVWMVSWLAGRNLLSYSKLELVGYASMLIALSMVFFGIKSYRDNYGNGKISFWKGVQIGLLISLIAGVLYFAGAESYAIAHPGFVDEFVKLSKDQLVGKLKDQGASQEQIDKSTAEIDQMAGLMQNPLVFFLICLVEIYPVGIVVTLISAGLLRKKEMLPA